MSIANTIQQLVSEKAPFQNRVEPIVAQEEGITLRCDVTSAENVGVTMTELDLARDTRRDLSMDELVHWAEWICGRVTYLLEPLRVIELDPHVGIALIRSGKPKQKSQGIAYYEMLADRHRHANLKRYQTQRRQPGRDAAPFSLTHEQLEVLIDDLVESTKPSSHR